MARHVAVVDSGDPRHLVVFREITRLWIPASGAAGELGDLALASWGWRRLGDWHTADDVLSAPVEPDPQHELDLLARDQQVGDERRGGER